MRTLIVFDRIADAIQLKDKVEKIIGGEVDVQSNTAEALHTCSVQRYDLLFVENYLPNLTGYEFSSMVRSISHNLSLPIFVLDPAA